MFKFLKKLFGSSNSQEISVEISSNSARTQSDDIADLKIPSREKITHVKIQEIPISDGETIEAKRKSKRYTIAVIPQAKNIFDFAFHKKITVFVLAGSKDEAIDALSHKLSGKYAFSGSSNSNTAEAGKWYDGNKYSMEILSFEKNTK